jgi:hypothetical protein
VIWNSLFPSSRQHRELAESDSGSECMQARGVWGSSISTERRAGRGNDTSARAADKQARLRLHALRFGAGTRLSHAGGRLTSPVRPAGAGAPTAPRTRTSHYQKH